MFPCFCCAFYLKAAGPVPVQLNAHLLPTLATFVFKLASRVNHQLIVSITARKQAPTIPNLKPTDKQPTLNLQFRSMIRNSVNRNVALLNCLDLDSPPSLSAQTRRVSLEFRRS